MNLFCICITLTTLLKLSTATNPYLIGLTIVPISIKSTSNPNEGLLETILLYYYIQNVLVQVRVYHDNPSHRITLYNDQV